MVLLSVASHDLLLSAFPAPPSPHASTITERERALLGAFLPYLVLLVTSRVLTSSDKRLPTYEFFWLCNTTLIMASLSPVLHRPLLTQAYAIAIAIDQILWYVDILGYAATGKCPVGVCKYMFWPETSLARKLTSSHHLWTIPVIVWGTCGLDVRGLILSFVVTAAGTVLTRMLTPASVRTSEPVKGESHFRDHYLNVNLSYEVWKDIKFSFLQITHPDPYVYLPKLIVRWCGLNGVVFGIMLLAVRLIY
jgi:hypothetical protein